MITFRQYLTERDDRNIPQGDPWGRKRGSMFPIPEKQPMAVTVGYDFKRKELSPDKALEIGQAIYDAFHEKHKQYPIGSPKAIPLYDDQGSEELRYLEDAVMSGIYNPGMQHLEDVLAPNSLYSDKDLLNRFIDIVNQHILGLLRGKMSSLTPEIAAKAVEATVREVNRRADR